MEPHQPTTGLRRSDFSAMPFSLPDLTPFVQEISRTLPMALAIILGAFVLNLIISHGLSILAEKTRLNPENILPFRRVFRWIIYLSAGFLFFSLFGLNLGGLWAVLSTVLAMVAIGFVAVWSVLSHILCTFLILLSRPFAVGDEVEFAGEQVKGRVIDLNFLYTTLQCEDNTVMQVPNNLFFQKVLKRRHGNGTVSLATQLGTRPPTRQP